MPDAGIDDALEAASAATLRWFGTPAFTHASGVTLPFRPERPFQLLAYLAYRRTWVTRDELAAWFWPEREPSAARANLRKVLLLAQRIDGPVPLELQDDKVRWTPDSDLVRLDAAARAGRHAEVIALYRPPLMYGLEEGLPAGADAWLDFERKRVADVWRVAAGARLVELAGDPAAAAALAGELLRVEPLDEPALLALGAACAAGGRQTEALRAIRDYASTLLDEYGIEPSIAVRALDAQLRSGASAAPSDGHAPTRERLPTAVVPDTGVADGFIGRRLELTRLEQLLGQEDCRVVSIVGPGGIGKSSLTRAAVARSRARDDGRVFHVVRLEDVAEMIELPGRVAAAIGLELQGGADAWAQIAARLGGGDDVLLLDNSEHLADRGLPIALEGLLASAPRLRIVNASRSRLSIAGEWLLALEGMPLPDSDETDVELLGRNDAVQLFAARASAAHSGFDLRAQAADVVELVHAVDGLPLALELAAAWVRLVPVREIVADIARSLDLLDGAGIAASTQSRDRGLRASFARSWQLIADVERAALLRVAMLPGAFGREMAQQVAECPLPLLASLVDKSLLRADGDGRFSLHPLIKQCTLEQNVPPVDGETQARRHAAFMAEWLTRFGDTQTHAPRDTLAAVGRELVHARAAWRWSIERHQPGVVERGGWVLTRVFEARGWWKEGVALMREAALTFAGVPGPAARAAVVATGALAQLLLRSAPPQEALQAARAALELARSLRDRTGIKNGVNLSGLAHFRLGELSEARACFEEALAHARADGDDFRVARLLSNLGVVEGGLGRYDAAVAYYADSVLIARRSNNVPSVAAAINNLATAHLARRDWPASLAAATEALGLYEAAGLRSKRPFSLNNMALAHLGLGARDEAYDTFVRALEAARESGDPSSVVEASLGLARLEAETGGEGLRSARQRLGEALAIAADLGWKDLQLKCVLVHARLQLAEGHGEDALALGDWATAQAGIDPAEVTRWRELAATHPREEGATSVAPDRTLAETMRSIAAESEQAPGSRGPRRRE